MRGVFSITATTPMIDQRERFSRFHFVLMIFCLSLMASCESGQTGHATASGEQANGQVAGNQKPAKAKPEKPSPDDHLAMGSWFWSQKAFDKAEAEFREAIEQHPESSHGYARLAGLLLTRNQVGEAIPLYQEAIMRDPKNPKLFAALSIAYLHQSRYSMAKSMAEEAIRLAPDMAQARKLNEYIDAKTAVVERTRSTDTAADASSNAANRHE